MEYFTTISASGGDKKWYNIKVRGKDVPMNGKNYILKLAVAGHPVGHSLSPVMHAANFRALGIASARYDAIDVEPSHLGAELRRLADEGYTGVNITVPHKIAALELMDVLDPSAVRYGAVNTVRIAPDGTMTGFNTDGEGFLAPLREAGLSLAGRTVALFGAGGAARAVARAVTDAGCALLRICNRTVARAEEIARWLGSAAVEVVSPQSCRGGDLIVNATSVGLAPDDPSAVPAELMGPGTVVYDLIPVARETATLAAARAAGARVFTGLGMLAAQGAAAFEIWTGRRADVAAMLSALNSTR